jgi:hypothetical protein
MTRKTKEIKGAAVAAARIALGSGGNAPASAPDVPAYNPAERQRTRGKRAGIEGGLLSRTSGQLLTGDDLTSAARNVGLVPDQNADAKKISAELSNAILNALSLGLSKEARSRERRTDRISPAILDLLRPGMAEAPISPRGLTALIGDWDWGRVLETDDDLKAFNRALGEAALGVLPHALRALAVMAQSAASRAKPRAGRRPDDAANPLLRAIADAHMRLFGFKPKLRNSEKKRDTPSVRWVCLVFQSAAESAPTVIVTRFNPLKPEVTENSPWIEALQHVADLSLDRLNDRLSAAMRGNRGCRA